MMEAKHICEACKRNFRASESYIKKHGYFCNDKKTHNDIDKAKISEILEKYDEALTIYKELGMDEDIIRVRKAKKQEKLDKAKRLEKEKKEWLEKVKQREEAKDYETAIQIWERLGEIDEATRVRKTKAKERERARDYETAIQIWEGLGEIDEAARVRKTKAKERERARDYETAIQIWEGLGEIDEAARVRKTQAEMGSVKVSQKVVHGDEVTEIKDSVLNRSSVGSGSSKMQELKDLTEMKKEGLIDDDEFKQMKKEILGK